MKVLVEKKAFLSILNNAMAHIVPKKATMPVIGGILLKVPKEGVIELSSTDLEIFLCQSMQAETEKDAIGQGWVIDGKFFTSLLPKLESEIIMLEFLKSTVKINVAKNSYASPFMDAKDFPIPPNLNENTKSIEYDTIVLKNYVNKCLPFTTENEHRPVLNGIHYVQKDKEVHIEAADMFKMIHAVDSSESDQEIDIVIPSKFAITYSKIYEGDKSELKTDDKYIRIDGDNFMLHGRLIDFKFPDTTNIFKQSHDNNVNVTKDTIIHALKRMMIVNTATKITAWNISPDKLELSSENKDLAMSGKEVFEDFKATGEPARIGLNPEFMITALNSFRSDVVNLQYKDKETAVIITDENNAVKTIVMPLMIEV